MSFAVPGALMLLGLALPVVLLYILKVRLRRMNVSTNLFWKQIYEEKPPRSIWQYFRHLLSLLLQLLLLALLAFSVADPYFPWQLLQARRIVVVIDNSASMQATDVDPTRFEAAIDSAVAMVEGLRFRDQMAIVLSGPTPEVVLGMTSHVPTLKRTLRELAVSDNPTELQSSIELGKKLIGEHPKGQVVVFTDGCYAGSVGVGEQVDDPLTSLSLNRNSIRPESRDPGEEREKPATSSSNSLSSNSDTTSPSPLDSSRPSRGEGEAKDSNAKTEVTVDFRIFGQRSANVGITQFQVRRSLIDPVGYQVLAAVQNASDEPVKCRLEIELDGAPVDVVPLNLEPNELWSRSIEKTSLEGGQLVARLTKFEQSSEAEPGEAGSSEAEPSENTNSETTAADTQPIESPNHLTCDDVAQAILPGREIQKVLVVTKGNLFLRKVFEANPLVQVSVAADFPETWPGDTIVVFDQEIPEQLPPNDVLVVDPSTGCDLWELGDPLRDPIVTDQDKDSPLMKHVRLDNVLMPEARKITINGKSKTLAGALSKDPVYAEVQRDTAGKCLVLTVNLEKSDLAFRTAFPIMVTNALGWFAGTSGELREATPTGDNLAFEWEPKEGKQLRLTSPDSSETVIPVGDSLSGVPEVDVQDATQSIDELESVTLGPFSQSGVWTVDEVEVNALGEVQSPNEETSIPALAQIAVNVANQRETDLRPPEELLTKDETEPLMASMFARPVWFYLVAAGCLLSVVEWFLYQRRVIA